MIYIVKNVFCNSDFQRALSIFVLYIYVDGNIYLHISSRCFLKYKTIYIIFIEFSRFSFFLL